jgi:pyrroloquinoline-quinone synthase
METLSQTSFHDDVRRIVADRHLLTHPFYVAWTNGELTLEQLRGYAGQYMHQVLAEPTYLSAVHANTPHFASNGTSDLSTRQAILQNLVDEELGPRNHPALWKQFAASLGLSEAQLAKAVPLPATRRLIETFANICRNRPYYAGLAALHAFESQVPDIAAVKIDGLKRFYGFENPAGYEFFTVHKDADVVHAATEWELIERAADTPAKRTEVLAATQEACDALWAFLSDVYATPEVARAV